MKEKKTKRDRDRELLNACYFGNDSLAIRLIREGADPSYADERDGWSCIHYAARWGRIRILHALFKAGVDINMRTHSKETALHKAAHFGRKEICFWLLKHGADADLVSNEGYRASDFTIEQDIKFICDHFEEFCKKIEEEKVITEKKKDKK